MHPIGLSLFTFADAAHTPHGDDNGKTLSERFRSHKMQLIPLTGTITLLGEETPTKCLFDATHTPYGDETK